MKIAVIGAGMAGVAAAQALASDGHEVTVVERRSSVAEETSFAPAGIAAAGLAAPWLPAPSRLQAMSGSVDEAGRLRGIGAAFAAPSLFGKGDGPEAARRAERALALHGLLALGVERIDELSRALGLDFERGDGLLLTLPDGACATQAEAAVAWLRERGEAAEWADAARQRQLEPGRAVADDAPRAVHLPNARIGNTREWTQLLRAHAQHLGVRFLFQHEVAAISAGPRPTVSFAAADEPARAETFDAVVVCAALESSRLLAPLGVKLPWKPIRGYSVTVAQHVREAAPDSGPRAALLDVRSGISISRLGARVRVAGGHESVPATAAAPAAPPTRKALQPLYDAVDNGFPGAVNWQQAQVWQAARAALADGLPAVGASGVPGVWLDVGHAHHGWALSQAAAGLLCAMIAGEPAPPEAAALAPQRLR
ncbi:NAD(P)/FAD-dependent oxidoreductase [Scleromatobacter humisilvae]|uniref:FAD-dependent oxidoreductase n=1 Tax=Scleromatobacter humisilvae TaxID=2897159 RepID=A0A9X1YHH5_9BURK|nr:FAD-dependent oxidoreductase [Scleromatobacter humisilvae]MCK9686574.1 FAD-dependent oxidoreductase [Scleromatobacter humisilvae]